MKKAVVRFLIAYLVFSPLLTAATVNAAGDSATSQRSAEITSPAAGDTVKGTITLSAHLTDDDTNDIANWTVLKGKCATPGAVVAGNTDGRMDDYDWDGSNLSASLDVTSWAEGSYCFRFDPSTGTSEQAVSASVDFQVADQTAPVVAITSPAEGATVKGMMDIRVTVSDDHLASYNVRVYRASGAYVDGAGYDEATGSVVDQLLLTTDSNRITNGKATLVLEATDQAGNTASTTTTINVDNPPVVYPDAEILAPEKDAEVEGEFEVAAQVFTPGSPETVDWAVRKGTCDAAGATVAGDIDGFQDEYTWSGSLFSALLQSSDFSSGQYCFFFYAPKGKMVSQPFTVKGSKPSTPSILGFKNPDLAVGAITNSAAVTADWSASSDADGIAGYELSLDYPKSDGSRGSRDQFVTGTQYTIQLGEGINNIKVRAKDKAGDYSDWSAVATITGDRTAPVIGFNRSSSIITVKGQIDIIGSLSDANLASYSVVISNAKHELIATSGDISQTANVSRVKLWSFDTSKLPYGTYTIRIYAKDAAGNLGSNSRQVVADNRPAPQTKQDCMRCGWKNFSYLGFKNQGQCVSYVNSHK